MMKCWCSCICIIMGNVHYIRRMCYKLPIHIICAGNKLPLYLRDMMDGYRISVTFYCHFSTNKFLAPSKPLPGCLARLKCKKHEVTSLFVIILHYSILNISGCYLQKIVIPLLKYCVASLLGHVQDTYYIIHQRWSSKGNKILLIACKFGSKRIIWNRCSTISLKFPKTILQMPNFTCRHGHVVSIKRPF